MAKSTKTPRSRPKKRVRRTPEEARALIIAAADELVAEAGPDKLGLVAIANRAGVSHGLVSHYFGTIDNLLEAIMTQAVDRRRARLFELLPTLAREGTAAFLDHFFEAADDPVFNRLVVWAVVSGRVEATDFGPAALGSGKLVADAIEASYGPGLDRESLEAIILLTMCTGIGYALAGDAIWRGLGRTRTKPRDRAFRAVLARMIEAEIGARKAP